MDWFAFFVAARERKWLGYAVAVLGSAAAILLRLAIGKALMGMPFITFIPVILAATLFGGFVPGLLAIGLGGFLAAHYLIAPMEPSLLWPYRWSVLLAYSLISLVIVALTDFAMASTTRLTQAMQLLQAGNETLEARIAARTETLMKVEEQLRQSQKMEAVGQLTGGLAHDFNNMLTGITGSLELMQRRLNQSRYDDLERYVSAAQLGATRAATLTQRLLAFSRQQTLDPKLTCINRLVAGMEELIRRTVGPAIELEVAEAPGLWPVLADPNQLEQALLNLCINASDALPAGGKICISTANRWLEGPLAKVQELPPGQYVTLSVSDNGTGMKPDIVQRAFDPFFTTKPLGQGTGLGLSMIYGFVRQSGGQVRIYSEPDRGTVVCITLPRQAERAETEPVLPQPQAETPAALARSVLVIDDEDTIRMLIAEVLEDHGCVALTAADGPSGLEILRGRRPIDLLITDIGLPGGMDGRQVAEAARLLRPALKVLFITGYAELGLLGLRPAEAGTRVLTKPFTIEALSSQIGHLVAEA